LGSKRPTPITYFCTAIGAPGNQYLVKRVCDALHHFVQKYGGGVASDEIYRHPKMPYTQRLLASIPKGWHGEAQ